MNRKLLYISTLLTLLPLSAFARDVQTIEGNLEIANNMFVIVADRDFSGRSDFDDSTVTSRRIMLIGYASEKVKDLVKLAGKRVRAKGILGQAFTRYHAEPLVLSLEGFPEEIK